MSELREAEAFLRACLPEGGRVLCAVSGGLDSMCLLHFVVGLEGFSVTAAHFNHQLRGETALRDQRFVEDWCRKRAIPCVTASGDTRARAKETGETLEEAARKLRYAFLESAGKDFDAILTAHHADDNAETVLFHLLRGTGTAGLGGIPRRRGKILRPFLPLERETLERYAKANNIPHVEDETNEEELASRNVLRRRVMPVLKELNPRAAEHISRAAVIVAEENALLEQLAGELADQGEAAAFLAAPEVLALRAALILLGRHAGTRKDLTALHAAQLLELCRKGRGEAHFPGRLTAEVSEGRLAFRFREEEREVLLSVGETAYFGPWRAEVSREDNGGWPMRLPAGAPLRLTNWKNGDRLTLPGSRGSRSFKRLCTDKGISPGERDALPTVRLGEACVGAARLGMDLDHTPGDGEEKIYIKFYLEGEQQ